MIPFTLVEIFKMGTLYTPPPYSTSPRPRFLLTGQTPHPLPVDNPVDNWFDLWKLQGTATASALRTSVR